MDLTPEKRAELVNYIREARAADQSDKEIKEALLAAGWEGDAIKPVLKENKTGNSHLWTTVTMVVLALISFSITGYILWLAFR